MSSPKRTKHTNTIVLSFDIETSGQAFGKHFLVEVAGVATYCTVHETPQVVSEFTTFVRRPENRSWEPRCVEEFWTKLPDKMYETALKETESQWTPTMHEAGLMFKKWIKTLTDEYKTARFVMVSDNPGFDIAWINLMLGDISINYLITGEYQSVLDLGSFYLGLGNIMDPDARSKKTAAKKFGLEDLPTFGERHTHHAKDDARLMGKQAAWVMHRLS